MTRPILLRFVLVVLTAALSTAGLCQTGSYWEGVIDANIPVRFYAERFNKDGITGRVFFGSARFGYAETNVLCDSARIDATREGDKYVYEISGGCKGRGTLRFADGDPNKLVGTGTISDAASASGYRRRIFYMVRE